MGWYSNHYLPQDFTWSTSYFHNAYFGTLQHTSPSLNNRPSGSKSSKARAKRHTHSGWGSENWWNSERKEKEGWLWTYAQVTLPKKAQLQVRHLLCLSAFKQYLLREHLEKGGDLTSFIPASPSADTESSSLSMLAPQWPQGHLLQLAVRSLGIALSYLLPSVSAGFLGWWNLNRMLTLMQLGNKEGKKNY